MLRLCACVVVVLAAVGCSAHDGPVYVALGGDTSYAEAYHQLLQDDRAAAFVRITLADGERTAAGLMAAIRDDAAVSVVLSTARVVTLHIGAREVRDARTRYQQRLCGGADNQDCLRTMVRLLDRCWAEITAGVLRHVQPSASVRALELYHPWVGGDKNLNTVDDEWEHDARGSDFEVMREHIRRLNASIREHAAEWNIPVAGIYSSINGPRGTDDPVTLGYLDASATLTAEGNARVALALRRLGFAPTPAPPSH